MTYIVLSQVEPTWGDRFVGSFSDAFDHVLRQSPHIVAMGMVLVVGIVTSLLLAQITARLGRRVGVDSAAARLGLERSFRRAGVAYSISGVFARCVFVVMMCFFAILALNVLGMQSVDDATRPLLEHLPRFVIAVVIVAVGLTLAAAARALLTVAADRMALAGANVLPHLAFYGLVTVVAITALDYLGVRLPLLSQMVTITFAAVAFALALAFGLGGRDVSSGIVSGFYLRRIIHPGDRVAVAGLEGTVRTVGPVTTVIETEEKGMLNRHSIPNGRMLAEAVR